MVSNFLGDVSDVWRGIISGNELIAREGVNLQKGMNYRKEPLLSVFLVLPSHDGGSPIGIRPREYRDEWHEDQQLYIYEGHDSTTVEGGKQQDQIAMYPDGRLSDNGKFYKAAHAFKDGIRKEPIHIQVYEKLEPGVWYDKGIFNLVDAVHVTDRERKIFKFHLRPADAELDPMQWDRYRAERLLSAATKARAWEKARGRCEVCGSESGLHFIGMPSQVHVCCSLHQDLG